MTLDELALKHGTDKSSAVHYYTRYYEQYFKPLRDKPLRLLEIGIQNGASIRMWRDYFPNAIIIGVDKDECNLDLGENTYTVKANQGNRNHLRQIIEQLGPFDIVIDDGSHINKHLLLSFETLFPALNPQGLYIAEDLHTCYWGRGFGRPTFIKRLKKLIDDVNGRGKKGIADRDKPQEYIRWMSAKPDWWEDNVEYMHLYRGIVFIKRV